METDGQGPSTQFVAPVDSDEEDPDGRSTDPILLSQFTTSSSTSVETLTERLKSLDHNFKRNSPLRHGSSDGGEDVEYNDDDDNNNEDGGLDAQEPFELYMEESTQEGCDSSVYENQFYDDDDDNYDSMSLNLDQMADKECWRLEGSGQAAPNQSEAAEGVDQSFRPVPRPRIPRPAPRTRRNLLLNEGNDGGGVDATPRPMSDLETIRHEVERPVVSKQMSLPTNLSRDKRYPSYREFAQRRGFTEDVLRSALERTGLGVDENRLLEELIRMKTSPSGRAASPIDAASLRSRQRRWREGGRKRDSGLGVSTSTSVAGSASSSWMGDSGSGNMGGVDSAEFMASNSAELTEGGDGEAEVDGDDKRAIVIDGSNVAMRHGQNRTFSCRGIQLAVDFFRARGHGNITVFVPQWRKESTRPEAPITNQEILEKLEKEQVLVFTPSRRIRGHRVVCYDDRYILKLAVHEDGVIVSNDYYRDLIAEAPKYKKVVEERLLMYTFVNDLFMPPDDPLGRHGPSLTVFLSKKGGEAVAAVSSKLKRSSGSGPCPYGLKCTYGAKCKFYHPTRDTLSSTSSNSNPNSRRASGEVGTQSAPFGFVTTSLPMTSSSSSSMPLHPAHLSLSSKVAAAVATGSGSREEHAIGGTPSIISDSDYGSGDPRAYHSNCEISGELSGGVGEDDGSELEDEEGRVDSGRWEGADQSERRVHAEERARNLPRRRVPVESSCPVMFSSSSRGRSRVVRVSTTNNKSDLSPKPSRQSDNRGVTSPDPNRPPSLPQRPHQHQQRPTHEDSSGHAPELPPKITGLSSKSRSSSGAHNTESRPSSSGRSPAVIRSCQPPPGPPTNSAPSSLQYAAGQPLPLGTFPYQQQHAAAEWAAQMEFLKRVHDAVPGVSQRGFGDRTGIHEVPAVAHGTVPLEFHPPGASGSGGQAKLVPHQAGIGGGGGIGSSSVLAQLSQSDSNLHQQQHIPLLPPASQAQNAAHRQQQQQQQQQHAMHYHQMAAAVAAQQQQHKEGRTSWPVESSGGVAQRDSGHQYYPSHVVHPHHPVHSQQHSQQQGVFGLMPQQATSYNVYPSQPGTHTANPMSETSAGMPPYMNIASLSNSMCREPLSLPAQAAPVSDPSTLPILQSDPRYSTYVDLSRIFDEKDVRMTMHAHPLVHDSRQLCGILYEMTAKPQ